MWLACISGCLWLFEKSYIKNYTVMDYIKSHFLHETPFFRHEKTKDETCSHIECQKYLCYN